MQKVITHMTMSLDGFVAGPDDQPAELFEWYEAGEISVPNPNADVTFSVDEESARALHELVDSSAALVTGRRLFDLADGWGDAHPSGATVVVVTHRPPADAAERWPRTVFVGDVETAVRRARTIAGDQDVTIASASIGQQAMDLGLVDEVCVSLVPVVFGSGVRYFGQPAQGHLALEDPVVIPGRRALHLRYPVRREESA